MSPADVVAADAGLTVAAGITKMVVGAQVTTGVDNATVMATETVRAAYRSV
jgi:hypothetical protein